MVRAGSSRPRRRGRDEIGDRNSGVVDEGEHGCERLHQLLVGASSAIAAGTDVKVIQTMLGHKDASMILDIYGHLFPDRLDDVAIALDRNRRRALKDAAA